MSAEIFPFDAGDSHSSWQQPVDVKSFLSANHSLHTSEERQARDPDASNMEALKTKLSSNHHTDNFQSIESANAWPTLTRTGTPPIAIPMNTEEARSRSRARAQLKQEHQHDSHPRPVALVAKSGRKRRKAANKPIATALNTVHGFTPVTSGDEGSDRSTEGHKSRKDLSIQRSRSILRKDLNHVDSVTDEVKVCQEIPSRSSSVSALSKQIERLNDGSPNRCQVILGQKSQSKFEGTSSVTSCTSGDEDTIEMTSYEVPLEHDFVSHEAFAGDNNDSGHSNKSGELTPQKMQAADFEALRCLGKGTYGTVLLVKQRSTGKLYAQKQFRKASLNVRKKLVEQTKTERSILESINRHAFVVKLFYAFQDREKLYLILEYGEGGELFERMRQDGMWPEDTAAFYMAEMVLALAHLHLTVGVVYRDLKPENCLLDAEGHLLLTDFGLSKVAVEGQDSCRSMAGTIEYMAPEVVEEKPYGTAVDWWSLGILGFDLMTGSTPFRANNPTKTGQNIVKAKPKFPYYVSPDAKSLLNPLLRKEPRKRLGSNMPKDLQAIKKHRFFRKIDWKALEKREVEPPVKPFITDPELAENFSGEFTSLALSPPVHDDPSFGGENGDYNQFGGFSFVGSRSLLEADGMH